jgi:hypothetical protein
MGDQGICRLYAALLIMEHGVGGFTVASLGNERRNEFMSFG